MVTSRFTKDVGRFTKQLFRCTRESSAAVDCAFFRGAMIALTCNFCVLRALAKLRH